MFVTRVMVFVTNFRCSLSLVFFAWTPATASPATFPFKICRGCAYPTRQGTAVAPRVPFPLHVSRASGHVGYVPLPKASHSCLPTPKKNSFRTRKSHHLFFLMTSAVNIIRAPHVVCMYCVVVFRSPGRDSATAPPLVSEQTVDPPIFVPTL